jgi:hypothetical protein
VPGARSALGFSVKTVFPLEAVTLAGTAEPPAAGARVNVPVPTVAGSMASEKVATASAPGATPVAPAGGVRPLRVGAVVSGSGSPPPDRGVAAGPLPEGV